jgi:hypothetical protein
MSPGDGVRRNVADISPEERTRFINAIIKLNSRKYPGRREDSGAVGGVTYWFKQDEIHAHTHVVSVTLSFDNVCG